MNTVHGHEAIALIKTNGVFTDKTEIVNFITANFPNTLFYTCSLKDLSAIELVDFLLSKNKIMTTASGMSINTANICNH